MFEEKKLLIIDSEMRYRFDVSSKFALIRDQSLVYRLGWAGGFWSACVASRFRFLVARRENGDARGHGAKRSKNAERGAGKEKKRRAKMDTGDILLGVALKHPCSVHFNIATLFT